MMERGSVSITLASKGPAAATRLQRAQARCERENGRQNESAKTAAVSAAAQECGVVVRGSVGGGGGGGGFARKLRVGQLEHVAPDRRG